ncbi:MAG: PRC-barrel domain-containing protein [Nitrospirota bacterium]
MAAQETKGTVIQRVGTLRSIDKLTGFKLRARDSDIGKADEFLFDDISWTVRYLVADTGGWLSGRKVLIAPAAFEQPDWEQEIFPVVLTREQVENSPGIEADKPISRQHQSELYRFYGWSPYWIGDMYHNVPPLTEVRPEDIGKQEGGDPHLRSTKEVTGYGIQATDGEIGEVEDFLVNDEDWIMRYIIVDTRKWLPGKKVLIATQWIKHIDWAEEKVHVDLTKDAVRNSPEYNPNVTVDRYYEARLYDYYSRPHYWI